ncbi:uncharacterized protein LOC110458897 isoform X1 [Mizuhopecten yessoensis]|nr:uncharacterized protein LOC110458897 isoform X1 [Mizuhopecten yessoensis]
MATMASCSILVVAFSCILKVGSLPTTITVDAPNPTSSSHVDLILDSPHHHGQAPEQKPHQHHSSPSSHDHSSHVNKTSLGSLIHHLLDKDESHVTPVVQSFTSCVTNCLHPKHPPNPPEDQDDVGHDWHENHKGGPDVHVHPERNSDDDFDDEDSADILSQVGELLRGSSYHDPLNSHPGPAGGHLDDDISRYWMCSHACLLTTSQYVIG